jgi:hypothetical protein
MDHHHAAIPYQSPWQLELTLPSSLDTTPSRSSPSTGLSYLCNQPLDQGLLVQFRLPSISDQACSKLWVALCEPHQRGYLLSLRFMNDEQLYRFRMMEQLSEIYQYQQRMRRQGRHLDLDQAANEWINRFAASFKSVTSAI